VELKRCAGCAADKPVDAFGWKNKAKGQRRSRCKECAKSYASEYYKKNTQAFFYYELKRRYGLNKEQYDDLLKTQDYRCAICFDTLITPHVDHDHETNKVRGLLCTNCNLLLGHAEDNVNILSNAVSYLVSFYCPKP